MKNLLKKPSSGGALLVGRGQEVRQAGVYSNVIAHLLRNLEFVLKISRNMCAMTGLNIQSLVFLKEGVSICQLFIQILGYYGSKAVGRTVKIYPLPSPPPREGACSRKSNPQITVIASDRMERRNLIIYVI